MKVGLSISEKKGILKMDLLTRVLRYHTEKLNTAMKEHEGVYDYELIRFFSVT